MRRRRWAVLAATLAVLAIASQLVIPVLGERSVENRLTENGGEASADIRSFPALRLLWSSGERIEVEGSGLRLDGDVGLDQISRLDGFRQVRIRIADSTVGPIHADELALERSGDEGYRMTARGDLSPARALAAGARELGLPGGSLAPALADLVPDFLDPSVPVELDVELESDDGDVRVISGGGTVAGVPTEALAELIARTLATRL